MISCTNDSDVTVDFLKCKIVMDVFVVSFLCVFGITGNFISIIVLGKDHVVRRTTGWLLQVLALTDIFYLVSCIFYQTLNTIMNHTDWLPALQSHWPYIEVHVWPCASIAQTCTVWLVVVVTADRYIAICRPLHAPLYSTMSRMRKVVVIVIMLSVIYNLPRFFERRVLMVTDPDTNITCFKANKTALRENVAYFVGYKTISFFVLRFCIPLTSLAFFNCRLIQAIRDSYRQRREMPGDQSQNRRERYSLTLVVVVAVFLLCETPDFILRIWYTLSKFFPGQVPFNRSKLLWVNMISNLFLAINSCSNFVIYCFMGARFRRTLLELLHLKPKLKPRINTTNTSVKIGQSYRFSKQMNQGEEMSTLVSR